MKANSLFGIEFSGNRSLKASIIAHFTSNKQELKLALNRKLSDAVIGLGGTIGITREEAIARLGIEDPQDTGCSGEIDYSSLHEIQGLLQEAGCRQYYITQSVLEDCQRLKAKEPFDLEWLQPMEDGKRQLNFGNTLLRFQKTGCSIFVLSVTRTPKDKKTHINYSFFKLDLDTKTQSDYRDFIDDDEPINEYDLAYDANARRTFFRLITFMELAPVEEVFLPAGRKHGTRKSENGLMNKSPYSITIVSVTRNWNRILHVGEFNVVGHYRLQRWGPCFQFRKLIWINQFTKEGYNLDAAKNSPVLVSLQAES
ncbi:MAG: hypothetical protein P4L51_06020 [Puia sp.]|nr:hypothetical protein [Puia sp.]